MEYLMQWVKQIFILNILSEIITHLMPSEKYAKYGSYICGILIVMSCVLPVAKILNSNVSFDDIYSYVSGYSQLELLKKELEYNESDSGTEIIAQFKEEIEKEIDEKILDSGYFPVKTEVVIETDCDSGDFGKVKSVTVVVADSKDEQENVVIHGNNLKSAEYGTLRSEIAEMLNVTVSNVTVKGS
jgi:stage III sporulation protein AF